MDPKLVIIEYAKNMIFEDSSEGEEDIIEKVENYVEVTVPNMSDHQFKRNFRLTAFTFEDLLQKTNQVLINNNVHHHGFPMTTTEKGLLVTIWYLGNMESLRSVAERFGLSKSTCWAVVYRTCKLLCQVQQEYRIIHWPSRERQEQIRASFARHGFPGIIGCIDGSHIKIPAPKNHPNSYVNRKNFHSLLLQGVCDHELLFTDVYAGEAGSIHDYTLFRRSDLYQRIYDGEVTFYDDNHMIGDLAYKLSTYLLTNYKRNRNLNPREINYNKVLSKSRVTIEKAFAFLKGRFRRLKFLETVRLDLAALLILSACILHNVCILNGDLIYDIVNLDAELEQERLNNPHNLIDMDPDVETQNALVKRNGICYALPLLQNRR